MNNKEWIGIAFFGVLTKAKDFTNWVVKGNREIEAGLELAKKINESNEFKLKIFQYYANEIDLANIKEFLRRHDLENVEITYETDEHCAYLLLPNAFRLIGNKGEFCKECKKAFDTLTNNAFSTQANEQAGAFTFTRNGNQAEAFTVFHSLKTEAQQLHYIKQHFKTEAEAMAFYNAYAEWAKAQAGATTKALHFNQQTNKGYFF